MLHTYRFDIWFSMYVCAVALTQLLGAKTSEGMIFGVPLSFSVSLFLVPFVVTMTEVVLEVAGRERANGFALAGLCAMFFVACISALLVAVPASATFLSHVEAYTDAFQGSLRFAITSLLSFACLQFCSLHLFAWIQRHVYGKVLGFRLMVIAALALGVDTFIFTIVDYARLDLSLLANAFIILKHALPYLTIRWAVACAAIPFAYLGTRWLSSAYAD